MNLKSFFLINTIVFFSFVGFASAQSSTPKLGVVSGLAQDSLAYAAGFTMIGESVRKMLAPPLTEAEFLANAEKIKSAKCKVATCNLFFPASLKIAGPDVIEAEVLAYCETVLSRAGKAGVEFIVLGSGRSREIPEGYDVKTASSKFIVLGKKLGDIAKRNNVTIVLENLETTETNFITSFKSATEIVAKINHPNFRLNADIFHMMRQNESPDDIVAAGKLISFCEIAEKEKRTFPGVMGDDFKPYLSALKKIKYRGYIFIEGSTSNPSKDIPQAFTYLTNQLNEVYNTR